MANYTQNITFNVNCFGPAPSTKWGQANFPYTMTWGTSLWGEGQALETRFIKVVTNSQNLSWDYTRSNFTKNHSIGTMVVTHDMASQALRQGDWNYVFTSDTTAGESRDFASWTEISKPDATFTCQAAAGTSWSEV